MSKKKSDSVQTGAEGNPKTDTDLSDLTKFKGTASEQPGPEELWKMELRRRSGIRVTLTVYLSICTSMYTLYI